MTTRNLRQLHTGTTRKRTIELGKNFDKLKTYD